MLSPNESEASSATLQPLVARAGLPLEFVDDRRAAAQRAHHDREAARARLGVDDDRGARRPRRQLGRREHGRVERHAAARGDDPRPRSSGRLTRSEHARRIGAADARLRLAKLAAERGEGREAARVPLAPPPEPASRPRQARGRAVFRPPPRGGYTPGARGGLVVALARSCCVRFGPPSSQERLDRVAIRFAGDSGDGMQLTGTKFTESTALAGNDLSTLPDFPAEIRAPAGTLAGVSGFQIHFSSQDIRTPADQADVLVAFNPAALRANLADVRPQRHGDRQQRRLHREEPRARRLRPRIRCRTLRERFRLVEIPMTRLTLEALQDLGALAARGRPLEELLRARPHVLALRPADRADRRVDRERASRARCARRTCAC